MNEKNLSPYQETSMSLETAIKSRRSIRKFTNDSISFSSVSQILHSTLYTNPNPNINTNTSFQIYFTCTRINGLKNGLYFFNQKKKNVKMIGNGNLYQEKLYQYGLEQDQIKNAAMNLVICGVYDVGEEIKNHIEVGKVVMNCVLQCVACGLGSVVVGAFEDMGVKKSMGLKDEENPLIILPIGKPRV